MIGLFLGKCSITRPFQERSRHNWAKIKKAQSIRGRKNFSVFFKKSRMDVSLPLVPLRIRHSTPRGGVRRSGSSTVAGSRPPRGNHLPLAELCVSIVSSMIQLSQLRAHDARLQSNSYLVPGK